MKTLSTGSTVCNITLATTEKWTDKSGEKKEHTEWHNVAVWSKLAELCGKYLSKGSMIYVEGKLKTEVYEKDGQKKYTTRILASNVQFLVTKRQDEQPSQEYRGTDGLPNFADDTVPF
jgi:single-strand DNA-binding protein